MRISNLLAGVLIVGLACCQAACESSAPGLVPAAESGPAGSRTAAHVKRVVDGDTVIVVIEGHEETLRLIGINTPETAKSPQGAQPGGEEASAFSRDRLTGRDVELEFDMEKRDPYGRLLAYLWLDGQFFNETLVREGLAEARTYPPNTARQEILDQAEREARSERLGIWQ